MNVLKAFVLKTAFSIALASSAIAQVTIISPWHTAGNGSYTDYGIGWFSVPNLRMDFLGKDAFGNTTTTGLMQIWALGFSDLHGISYSGTNIANVKISDVNPWTGGSSLMSFDIGVFGGGTTPRSVTYQIWNGDFTTNFASGTLMIGGTHASIDVSRFSPNGFNLQFSSAGYVGIDNIAVGAGSVPGAVPEPSTYAALIAAVALGFAFWKRRR